MKPILFLLLAPVLWSQTDDPTGKARRAAELVLAGQPEKSIPLYQDLVHTFPRDAGILLNLSIAEFKARRYADAASHAKAVLKIQPDSPAANLFLGSSYEELGEHALALEPLEKVLAVRPHDRNARLMFAEALLNLERYETAAAQFQNAVDLASDNARVWYGLGRAYEALSEKISHQLENTNSDSPYWHALAGDLYLKQRRYGSAFTYYRLALASNSNLPGVHAGLATVYERTGHTEWAKIEDQRERQSTPDCSKGGLACDFTEHRYREISQVTSALAGPEAQYWASKAFAKMAHAAYEHLAQLPGSLEAHLHKAKALDAGALAREAAAEWREALKLAPGDVHIETALAWSLYRAGEFDSALSILRELLHRGINTRELNFLCGATLLNLDNPESAIPPLESAIRLDGNFLPARAALGQALLQTGKPALAVPHLKAALPGDEDAKTHFGLLRAYQLTGQTELAEQAKMEYQKALRAAETNDRLQEAGTIVAP
jgi:tetratricopeptide (TPR) repeat protein